MMVKKVIGIALLVLLVVGVFAFAFWPEESDCYGPGPTYPFFGFYSIEEFLMYFEPNVQTGLIPAAVENRINYRAEREEISAEYTGFVEKMVENPVIYVPVHNQEIIPFENKEGFYNIDLLTKWTADLPWVQYSLLSENGPLTVEILYSNDFQGISENEKLQKKEIALLDRTVSAFIEEKQNGGIAVSFPYDEIYVVLRANAEVLTDQWLKGLGFSKYTSTQWYAQTADDIVCNNDVFLELQSNMVRTIGYHNEFACVCGLGDRKTGFVYNDELTYAVIKLLKEEPLYETTSKECHDYGNRVFEIVLKNGEKRTLSFVRDELQYNGHTYTGFSHDFLGRLIELFDL